MMHWEKPVYLHCGWGLLVLVLGFYLSRRAAGQAGRRLGAGISRGPLRNDALRAIPFRFALSLLAFAAMVLALANPLRSTAGRGFPTTGSVDLVFAVDVSTSMLTADVLPDRLTQARKFVFETTRGLNGGEIGIVVFAGDAQLYVPLTTDYNAVRRACSTISPNIIPRQGTSIAKALSHAALLFKAKRQFTPVICLISDGESHTQGYQGIADSLSKAGVALFSVGIGTPKGDNILVKNRENGPPSIKKDSANRPIVSQLHEENLKSVVRGHADRYIRLDDPEAGVALFLQTVNQLPDHNPSATAAEPKAYFQLLLLLAFGLLLTDALWPSSASVLSNSTQSR